MKKLNLLLILFIPFLGFAQTLNPVKWEAKFTQLTEITGEIVITAKIDKGWHIYSQRPTDVGPIPTSFVFAPGSNFELVGKTNESNAKEEYVKAFEAKVWIFDEKAVFTQNIKIKNTKGFNSTLKLEFMTCNDIQCLPPKTIDLQITVPAKK